MDTHMETRIASNSINSNYVFTIFNSFPVIQLHIYSYKFAAQSKLTYYTLAKCYRPHTQAFQKMTGEFEGSLL